MNFKKLLLFCKPMIPEKYIYGKEEVVEYSFIVQKSITYLDLSLCEFSSFSNKIQTKINNLYDRTSVEKNVVFTEEAFRKSFAPDRKLLYHLHLDVSNKLEFSLRNVSDEEIRPFYSSSVLLNKIVFTTGRYKTYFNEMLTDTLQKSNQKVKFMHQITKMAKCMKFILQNQYIRDSGLDILYFHRADSTVVVDFLSTMDFPDGHFLSRIIDVFEFVLKTANQVKFDLWILPHSELINASIQYHLFLKTETLLQYRDAPRFCTTLYIDLKEKARSHGLLQEGLDCPVFNGLMSRERHFLVLQMFEVFCGYRCRGLRALQMLWRSIPDPFLTEYDLTSVFLRHPNPAFIEEVCSFIKGITGKNIVEGKWQPRTLQHNCRIAIRRSLSKNFQLATGLNDLQLSSSLKDFIRLVD